MKFFLLISLLVPMFAQAIPEEDFARNWSEKALPFFRSMTTGTVKNNQGLKLKYFYYKNPLNVKSLVIVPGRTEPAIKYAELIYDLKESGFDIFIMDHQGQGESDRILTDTNKGHVVDFKNYVQDFELFMQQVVYAKQTQPLYLIAHSMGGAISTQYMSAHPRVFTKAVLVAPMFEMNTAPYSETVARYYAKLLVTTGKGNNYAPNYGPYVPENDTFEKNTNTHSEVRFLASKYIFTNMLNLVVGGPTARWVHESLKATQKIDRLPVETPVLLLQAGLDQTVKPARQEAFCKKGMCELITYPEAFHEILMEKDSIRDEAINEIKSFLGV